MSALGFRARMVLAGTVMFAFYLGMGALALSTGASRVVVVLQCVLFVLCQYVLGRRIAVRSVGARPLRASETPRLHKFARETAAEMGIDKPRLLVGLMGTPNAFAVGRHGSSDVVFSQSLLEGLDDPELKAVLAHEMAHIKHRDAIILLLGQTIATACGLAVAWVGFFAGRTGPLRTLALVGGAAVQIVVSLLAVGVVRRREFHADEIAGEYVDPHVLARALEHIDAHASEMAADENDPEPQVGYNLRALCIYGGEEGRLDRVFGTHPSIENRVQRLRALE